MMSNEDFIKAVRDPNVIFSAFMMTYSATKSYCFIEGADWGYYYQLYSCHGIFNVQPVPCYGKSNVIRLKAIIDNRQIPKTFFLVDRDYDDTLADSENLYITPQYSIENFYASKNFIENFLYSELKYSGGRRITPSDVEKISTCFMNRLDEFLNLSLELNAWSYYVKNNFKFSLNAVKVADVFKISLNAIEKTMNLDDLFKYYLPNENIEQHLSEIKKVEGKFKADVFRYCRGKYLLQFLAIFLRDLRERAPQILTNGDCTFSKQISEKNFISDFATYSDKPSCIRSFVLKAA